MQTYIVRQPILDLKKNVAGYEILYQQDESSLYGEIDYTAASAIETFLNQLDSEKFLSGKMAYFTFTPNLLLKNVPKIFSPKKLVVQIEDNAIVHPLAHRIIYRLKKQGYRIALKNFEFSPRYFGIMDVVDIIKIDFTDYENRSIANIINIGKSMDKEIIGYNINCNQAYEKAKELGCEYIQGSCVAEQITSKVYRMDYLKTNFFQLMVAVAKDEPNIDEISEIISRDVTLAFSLIKLVNSAYFALRNRAKSVKQALIILGLGQLKQWIYLLSFQKDRNNVSEELIRISFLRANFCSELSVFVKDIEISKSEAYLMGMFSTLGILMEVPLEMALAELPISDKIKNALLIGEGKCGSLLNLVIGYEQAKWREMAAFADELNIPVEKISEKYIECVDNVNTIWDDLMRPYEAKEEEQNQPQPVH